MSSPANPKSDTTANLRKAYALRLSDGLVTTTVAFAIPVLIYSITHNVKLSGISFMLEWLPRLVAIPIAGPLVDHFGSQRIFRVTSSVRTLAALAALVGLVLAPNAWTIILLFGIVSGMMAQASFVAAEHMGMSLTTSEAHKVQAAQVTIDQAVLVLGPLLGGVFLAIGKPSVFGFVAVLSLISLGITRKVVVPHETRQQKLQISRDLFSGFQILGRNRTLLSLSLGLAGTNLLFALIITMTPAFLSQHFQLGNNKVSLVWTIAAICSVVATTCVGRLVSKVGVMAIGVWSLTVACFAAGMLGFSHSYYIYVAIVAVFVSMDSAGSVFLRTVRIKLIPKDKYGVTVGAMVLALLAPYPIAGGLVAVLPFRAISWVLVVSALFTLGTVALCFRSIDRTEIEESAPKSKLALENE